MDIQTKSEKEILELLAIATHNNRGDFDEVAFLIENTRVVDYFSFPRTRSSEGNPYLRLRIENCVFENDFVIEDDELFELTMMGNQFLGNVSIDLGEEVYSAVIDLSNNVFAAGLSLYVHCHYVRLDGAKLLGGSLRLDLQDPDCVVECDLENAPLIHYAAPTTSQKVRIT